MGAYDKIVLSETDTSIFDNVSNSTVTNEIEKFNNSYGSNKVKDIFEAYENITITDEMLRETTLIKNNAISSVAKSALSFKQKLFFVSASMICAIMLFLCVFNIFVINGVGKDINILQDNIASEEKVYYDLYKDWSTATNNAGIQTELTANGYTLTSSENVVTIEPGTISQVENLSGSTNWFDAFCNFISSIFGS